MNKKRIYLDYNEVIRPQELGIEKQRLINKAKSAAKKAYAPYSGFHVGASVLLENGEIITGSNQENAAYPSGMCAERTALFAAASQFPDVPVKIIVIAALMNDKFVSLPVTPCGACRQVILETQNRYDLPVMLIMCGEEKSYIIENATDLLPLPFEKF